MSCLKHLIEVASLIDPLYHLGHSWSNKYKIKKEKDFSNYREASFWTKKKSLKGL